MEVNFCLNEKHKKSQFCVTSSERSMATSVTPSYPGWPYNDTVQEIDCICFSYWLFLIIVSLLDVSSSPDDDLERAIKLSLQDSGIPPGGNDGSGPTDSSSQSQRAKDQHDSDSDSEYDFCI